MIGKLLSKAIKVTTLPIDIIESSFDILAGGDGSKESREQSDMPFSVLRDGVCKAIEEIDEE